MHLMPLHTTDGDTSVVAVGVPAASDTVGGKGAGGSRGSRGEHTGSSLCSDITSSGRSTMQIDDVFREEITPFPQIHTQFLSKVGAGRGGVAPLSPFSPKPNNQ
jgi:hypothetical protein